MDHHLKTKEQSGLNLLLDDVPGFCLSKRKNESRSRLERKLPVQLLTTAKELFFTFDELKVEIADGKRWGRGMGVSGLGDQLSAKTILDNIGWVLLGACEYRLALKDPSRSWC